jgi:hypothetical protein
MLETPKERIELLKIGVTSKTIERLYIANNGIKIIPVPKHFEVIEIESGLPEKVQSKIVLSGENAACF